MQNVLMVERDATPLEAIQEAVSAQAQQQGLEQSTDGPEIRGWMLMNAEVQTLKVSGERPFPRAEFTHNLTYNS